MKKTTVKPEAVTFNVAYSDIAAGAKLIRDQIEQNISFAKKLAAKAKKLYKYGDKKCYAGTKCGGIGPIKGIKDLEVKMSNLASLAYDTVNDLKHLASRYDLEVK